MNLTQTDILSTIFTFVSDFDKIRILSLVCKKFYQMIKLIIDKYSKEDFEDFILNDRLCIYPIHHSIFNNWMCIMPYLCKSTSNLYKLIKKSHREKIIQSGSIMDWFAINGYVKFIKYFLDQVDSFDEGQLYDKLFMSIISAINYNQLKTVKFICKISNNRQYNLDYKECIRCATFCGNINIVKYLRTKESAFVPDFIHNSSLEMIEYWFDNGFDVDKTFFNKIIENNNINNEFVLKLIKLLDKKLSFSDDDRDVVRKFIENNCVEDTNNIDEIWDILIILSLLKNDVSFVEHLCDYFSREEDSYYISVAKTNIFDIIIKHSNIDIIKYLHKKYNFKIKSENLITSIKKNDVDVLKYLFDNCKKLDKYLKNDNRMYFNDNHFSNFNRSMLRTAKYIYETYPWSSPLWSQAYPQNRINLNLMIEYSKYGNFIGGIDSVDDMKNILNEDICENINWAVIYKNYPAVDYLYQRLRKL